jgi:preprotein translocase subunit SecE
MVMETLASIVLAIAIIAAVIWFADWLIMKQSSDHSSN